MNNILLHCYGMLTYLMCVCQIVRCDNGETVWDLVETVCVCVRACVRVHVRVRVRLCVRVHVRVRMRVCVRAHAGMNERA